MTTLEIHNSLMIVREIKPLIENYNTYMKVALQVVPTFILKKPRVIVVSGV
jgi:hypothetical protein